MNYEILFIVPPKYTEDEAKQINKKIISLLEENGANIIRTEDWGKKKFAYQIRQYRHGYYTLVIFSSSADIPQKITQKLNIHPDILRFQIVKEVKGSKTQAQREKALQEKELKKETENKDDKKEDELPEESKKEENKDFQATPPKEKEEKPAEKKEKENSKTKKEKVSIDDLDKKLDELLDDAL